MSCWEKLCDIDLLKQFLCYLAFCTKSIKQIVDLKKKYLNKRYFTRDIVVLGGPVFDWKLGKSICASSYVFPSVTLKQCPSTVSLLCHFLLFHVLTNPLFLGKGQVWSIKLSALPRVVVFATDLNPFFHFHFWTCHYNWWQQLFLTWSQSTQRFFLLKFFFNYHLLLIHCLAILVLSMIRKYWTLVSNTKLFLPSVY